MIHPVASIRRGIATNNIIMDRFVLSLDRTSAASNIRDLLARPVMTMVGNTTVYRSYTHELKRDDISWGRGWLKESQDVWTFRVESVCTGFFGGKTGYDSGILRIFRRGVPGADEGHIVLVFPGFYELKARDYAELVSTLSTQLFGARPFGLAFAPREPHSIFLWSTHPDSDAGAVEAFMASEEDPEGSMPVEPVFINDLAIIKELEFIRM